MVDYVTMTPNDCVGCHAIEHEEEREPFDTACEDMEVKK